jgi:hypothetical protein
MPTREELQDTGDIDLRLTTGRRCTLSQPRVPGLKKYFVLSLPGCTLSSTEAGQFHLLALQIAGELANRSYGDSECFALMYSAGRTRRKPWPHVHIVVASSVAARRRSVLLLQLKHVLWWRRWPSYLRPLLRRGRARLAMTRDAG